MLTHSILPHYDTYGANIQNTWCENPEHIVLSMDTFGADIRKILLFYSLFFFPLLCLLPHPIIPSPLHIHISFSTLSLLFHCPTPPLSLPYHSTCPIIPFALIFEFLNTSVFIYPNICVFKSLYIRYFMYRYI